MNFRKLVVALLSVTIFFALTIPAYAQDTPPGSAATAPTDLPDQTTFDQPADQPALLAEETPDPAILQAAGLPPLKAVLIVGPIDPENGNVATNAEIANMELAAARLIANGVQVIRLYTPNDSWASVVAAAQGANFLLYRGHGLYWGSPWPTPSVGGFDLTERMYTNNDITRDLKLAPNAIVMLYACLATGSSSTDSGPISQSEARRRVSQYSQPFFDLGAAGYYANWFGDAFKVYIDNLFSGKTLGDSFKNYSDYQANLAVTTTHQTIANLPEILSWDNWTPYNIPAPQYNNAFVGQSGKTLWDLFPASLVLSTNNLSYITKPSSSAKTFNVAVQSSGSTSVSWTASPSSGSMPTWVKFTPTTGTSGTVLKITLTPPSSNGKLTTSLTVSSADHSSSQTIAITLVTLSNPTKIFLPSIIR